ncbi:LamG domain-containing protein [Pelagicoccus sp. SDUM812005]|uniref:LamG domain-containing protein n=1 Tax=Pelagicoccus sp. SDUM812005 TaxID=3041257 RepID=UPI00281032D6|nr:LamG domain-containing protein [Pelagicoccus sp. SDUM812005]MDQ8179586.1 LamG domain-containing protein [Pelagicoccus sp. SDUM812005]
MKRFRHQRALPLAALALTLNLHAQTPEPELGERADWLRGSWGINWKPAMRANGAAETLVIDHFLDQIQGLRTIDYIQLHLGESHVQSPVHWGTQEIIESLWQGDTDANGDPINLAVPRASIGFDPFEEMLKAVKAAGMRTQVYVNSANMMGEVVFGESGEVPDVTERWMAWCDTNAEAQAFINSESYRDDPAYPYRKYYFCYTEFVLKDYAIRYGDLVDSWLFDASYGIASYGGDNNVSEDPDEQRLFQAFADACHAGNPNAAISFNNGVGERDGTANPFSVETLYDDYTFGHPFAGGKRIGDHTVEVTGLTRYGMNYSIIQWMTAKNGYPHAGDGPWDWDEKVVAHFDPPMSTSAWNSGGIPALTDSEFLLWNREAMLAGGAISWGAPLVDRNGANNQTDVLIQSWGMSQLTLMDDHLSEVQFPGAPNWARAETVLPDAVSGQAYARTLVKDVDFWDPEDDSVTVSLVGAPAWMSIGTNASGDWILSGMPGESEDTLHHFRLRASDGTNDRDRWVTLAVAGSGSSELIKGSVSIQAKPDTDYGTNEVATLVSSVIAAPDGLGSFQIAFDVTPMTGGSIQSGISGGSSTNRSWGIGADYVFKGSDGESADAIDNVRVINTTGSLLPSHFSNFAFETAEIVNGQSVGDRVLVTLDGVPASAGGVRMSSIVDDVDLAGAAHVAFENGRVATNDKWSINAIKVSYEIALQGLVANWALDEGAGAVASDYSGNGYDATIDSAAWVSGVDGQALDFNGSSSSVTLPSGAFSSVSDEVSIAMWVKGDLANPQANSVFYAQSAGGDRLLNIHLPWSNGQVYWDAGDGSGYDRINKSATPAEYEGSWRHWVFTKNANTGAMNIYLDGVLWHSGSGKNRSIGSVAAASLGSNLSTNSYNGAIDDVQLYNVALAPVEVEALYLAYAGGN